MSKNHAVVRLQKYIADAGITSRRKAEDLILQGRVEVNGDIIRELGVKVHKTEDTVRVDGDTVTPSRVEKVYVVFHKPRGCMTTLSDPEGRKTVIDYLGDITERIYPIGRLDYLSEGLLLLTNDGDTANSIIHPSGNIAKVYEVKIFGAVNSEILKTLRRGVHTEVGFLKPQNVRVIKQLASKTWLEFRLTDGKNREIRRLCEAAGLTIDKLKRVAIGGLTVEGIAPGRYRAVSKGQLLKLIGFDKDMNIDESVEYKSTKKSVNLRMKGPQDYTVANDSSFTKFRKDTYFDTLKELKDRKVQEAAQKEAAMYAEKERKHQDRVDRKKKRIQKKEGERGHVHAQIIKY